MHKSDNLEYSSQQPDQAMVKMGMMDQDFFPP